MSALHGDLAVMKKACDEWLSSQTIYYVLYTYRSTVLDNARTVHDIMPVIGEPRIDKNGDSIFLSLLGNDRTLKKDTFEIFATRELAKKRYNEIITSHCLTIRGGN